MRHERNSNLETVRIISMLLIVAGHFIGQSGITEYSNGLELFIECLFGVGGRLAVDIFVILSAWFMVDMEFNFFRVFRIWFQVLFYTVLITLLCLIIFGYEAVGFKNLIQAFFPVCGKPLWFASAYIILMFFSPFLNRFLKNGGKKIVSALILVLSMVVVFIPSFIPISKFVLTDDFGSDLFVFVFIYILIGGVKLYYGNLFNKFKYKVFFITAGILSYSTLVLLRFLPYILPSNYIITDIISKIGFYYRMNFNTVFCILSAVSFFMFFCNKKMKINKTINTFAEGTFGVYIVHQVPSFYPILWKGWMILKFKFLGNLPFFSIIVVIVTFFCIDIFIIICNRLIVSRLTNIILNLNVAKKISDFFNFFYFFQN